MSYDFKTVLLALAIIACGILFAQCINDLIKRDKDAVFCNMVNWSGLIFFAVAGSAILFEIVRHFHATN